MAATMSQQLQFPGVVEETHSELIRVRESARERERHTQTDRQTERQTQMGDLVSGVEGLGFRVWVRMQG